MISRKRNTLPMSMASVVQPMSNIETMEVQGVFGSVRKEIKGSNGCDCIPCAPKPKLTIYDNAMEVMSPYTCCLVPYLMGCKTYDTKMILRHRVMSGESLRRPMSHTYFIRAHLCPPEHLCSSMPTWPHGSPPVLVKHYGSLQAQVHPLPVVLLPFQLVQFQADTVEAHV